MERETIFKSEIRLTFSSQKTNYEFIKFFETQSNNRTLYFTVSVLFLSLCVSIYQSLPNNNQLPMNKINSYFSYAISITSLLLLILNIYSKKTRFISRLMNYVFTFFLFYILQFSFFGIEHSNCSDITLIVLFTALDNIIRIISVLSNLFAFYWVGFLNLIIFILHTILLICQTPSTFPRGCLIIVNTSFLIILNLFSHVLERNLKEKFYFLNCCQDRCKYHHCLLDNMEEGVMKIKDGKIIFINAFLIDKLYNLLIFHKHVEKYINERVSIYVGNEEELKRKEILNYFISNSFSVLNEIFTGKICILII
jgi:hypothetical protein